MTTALLCPGPSLPRVYCDDLFWDFDLVVGINTTAHKYRCHHLFCSDRHIVTPITEGRVKPPLISVITNKGLSLACFRAKVKADLITRLKGAPPRPVCAYTMPNALKWCLERGDVEIFGMDFSQSKRDFSGQKGVHDQKRWREEAAWLKQVWDAKKILAVHGDLSQERREWFEGKRDQWPE